MYLSYMRMKKWKGYKLLNFLKCWWGYKWLYYSFVIFYYISAICCFSLLWSMILSTTGFSRAYHYLEVSSVHYFIWCNNWKVIMHRGTLKVMVGTWLLSHSIYLVAWHVDNVSGDQKSIRCRSGYYGRLLFSSRPFIA